MDIESIKQKLYNQGRDLEVSIYNCLFESDEKEMVSYALSIYQNKDGGFGHGLEPDSTNPNSSPFQTSIALEILVDVGFRFQNLDEYTKSMVSKSFSYLAKTSQNNTWPLTIPSNNDFPCAIWWMHDSDKIHPYNPTASLLASILLLRSKQSSIYKKSYEVAIGMVQAYFKKPVLEKHDLIVLARLYHALCEVEPSLEFLTQFKTKLYSEIQSVIDPIENWEGYATMPFDFPLNTENYGISKTLLISAKDSLLKTLKQNYWEPNWQWYKDEEAFEIQSIKWHGILAIKYLSFLSHIQK